MTGAEQQWVYFFGDGSEALREPDKELLGGKGASLAALTRAKLPVPPGFTISTECCRAFFAANERWPDGLQEQVREHLRRLEQVTGRQFGRGSQPLLVSVRSGAAVSMPGMMDTILNCGLHPGLADEMADSSAFWSAYLQFVERFSKTVASVPAEAFRAADEKLGAVASSHTAEQYRELYQQHAGCPFPVDPWESLCECINAVFRSWNTDRAVAYRRHHDIPGLHGTAVNVQAMFPSQVSGILFTQDPNDVSAEQMVVESSYGLGESVVSGEVSPDRFVVAREDFRTLLAVIGGKRHVLSALGDTAVREPDRASLTDEQLAELGRLGLRIEELFGQPMDIEWGWAAGKFSLLQCRPIRGLDVARDVETGRTEEIERLRQLTEGRRRIWVAHNLGETLRAPTPLTWGIVQGFMSGDGGFGRLYKDLGYRPSPEVCRHGFLELIGQRVYADPERVAQLFWGRGPITYKPDELIAQPSLIDQAPSNFDPEKADGTFFLRLPGMVWSMIRASRIARRLRRAVKDTYENRVLPAYLEYVREQRERDLSQLATGELIAELHERRRRVLDEFGSESLKPGFFGGLAFSRLQVLLVQLLGPENGLQMACTLTMGLDGDTTLEQNDALYRVAAGEMSRVEFCDRFGHRAVNEMELAEPRWREDEAQVQLAAQTVHAAGRPPRQVHEERAARRAEVEAELPDVLAQWGGSSFREEIEDYLRQTQELLGYRESAKHHLMMGYELLRLTILELSRRWDLESDVFFLRLDELETFEQQRPQLREEIAGRKIRWQSLQRLDMPNVIDSEDLEQLGLPPQYESTDRLGGEAVAAGVATGIARIVFDPRECGDLGTDYILVCPSTDPGWTSLFAGARGLVVERGGVLSHGAIVARDFGIPAVVCPQATSRFKDGDRLQVDGNRGEVRVIEGEPVC